MWDFILPYAVKFAVNSLIKIAMKNFQSQEFEVLENDLKSKAKDWVYKQVPGEKWDPLAWGIIDAAWDLIVSQVKKELKEADPLSDKTAEKVTDKVVNLVLPRVQVIASQHLDKSFIV